jgi:hypothetical protein
MLIERLTWTLNVSRQDALRVLQARVDTGVWAHFGISNSPLRGRFRHDGFTIAPTLRFPQKNALLPVLVGSLEDTAGGSVVHIVIRPTILASALISVWFFGGLAVGLLMLFTPGRVAVGIVGLLVVLTAAGAATALYRSAARTAKGVLSQIFGSRIVQGGVKSPGVACF